MKHRKKKYYPDLKPAAGIMFALLLVVLLYAVVFFLVVNSNVFWDWLDPQTNIEIDKTLTPSKES